MKITKSELEKNYGINLSSGKYKIYVKDNNYEIYSVKDDTIGCILVGKKSSPHFVSESRNTFLELFKIMNDAIADKQTITIEIT